MSKSLNQVKKAISLHTDPVSKEMFPENSVNLPNLAGGYDNKLILDDQGQPARFTEDGEGNLYFYVSDNGDTHFYVDGEGNTRFAVDEAGVLVQDEDDQYIPDEDGMYVPDKNGQLIPDNEHGELIPDEEGVTVNLGEEDLNQAIERRHQNYDAKTLRDHFNRSKKLPGNPEGRDLRADERQPATSTRLRNAVLLGLALDARLGAFAGEGYGQTDENAAVSDDQIKTIAKKANAMKQGEVDLAGADLDLIMNGEESDTFSPETMAEYRETLGFGVGARPVLSGPGKLVAGQVFPQKTLDLVIAFNKADKLYRSIMQDYHYVNDTHTEVVAAGEADQERKSDHAPDIKQCVELSAKNTDTVEQLYQPLHEAYERVQARCDDVAGEDATEKKVRLETEASERPSALGHIDVKVNAEGFKQALKSIDEFMTRMVAMKKEFDEARKVAEQIRIRMEEVEGGLAEAAVFAKANDIQAEVEFEAKQAELHARHADAEATTFTKREVTAISRQCAEARKFKKEAKAASDEANEALALASSNKAGTARGKLEGMFEHFYNYQDQRGRYENAMRNGNRDEAVEASEEAVYELKAHCEQLPPVGEVKAELDQLGAALKKAQDAHRKALGRHNGIIHDINAANTILHKYTAAQHTKVKKADVFTPEKGKGQHVAAVTARPVDHAVLVRVEQSIADMRHRNRLPK